MRVFIVDDAPFVREILKSSLRRLGHEIVGETGDGAKAVQAILLAKPHLVFMDIVLPGKNGIEIVQDLRMINPDIPIVAISSLSQSYIMNKAIEAGCNIFLSKPFSLADIKRAIDSVHNQSSEAVNE
jgi:two-component system, chemotaxis family, chemotaxis protein CheY